jgi:hypothetical protein
MTSIFLLFSCTKTRTENRIIGVWKVINVADITDSVNVERWQFVSDGKLKIFLGTSTLDTTPSALLHYNVKSYNKLIIEPADSVSPAEFCHTWQIIKLNKDILMMDYKDGGLVQKEFVKE